eukprot:1919135-Ditylum_brightwellii.AAC.1
MDILLLNEINIPWNHTTEHTCGNYFHQCNIQEYKINGTSSSELYQNFYLSGCCTIFLQGPAVGMITGYSEDDSGMGYWC